MEKVEKYQINFLSLPLGKHEFIFDVKDSFFVGFEYGEIKQGNVTVKLLLEKKPHLSILDFVLDGHIKTNCDRCLDEIDVPIKGPFRMLVKELADTSAEDQENEDLIVVGPNEHRIDLSTPIYEFIHLLLPMQRTCSDTSKTTCNEEIEAKLKQFSTLKTQEEETDPRWDALKKIKLKNNN